MKKVFTNIKKGVVILAVLGALVSSVGNSGANEVRPVGEVVIEPVEID